MASGAIDTAMIFSAGLGKRMLPLTNSVPKPLVRVLNRPILDYIFDLVIEAKIQNIVINSHHLAPQIESYIIQKSKTFQNIQLSHEDILLETGGGIVKALPMLGKKPFFTLNGDSIIINSKGNSILSDMQKAWDADKMDILMLLHPTKKAVCYSGPGDFNLTENGNLVRPKSDQADYVFAGVHIFKPELFSQYDIHPFSLREIYKERTHQNGELYRVCGIVNNGDWLHVDTPESIVVAESYLKNNEV